MRIPLPVSDASKSTKDGMSPLGLAARRQSAEVLSLMLAHCHAKAPGDNRWTALMWAAWAGIANNVKILIPLSNANAENRNGDGALGLAAKEGRDEVVALLLPFCDPRKQSSSGFTALMEAARSGHRACVERLLPASDLSQRAAITSSWAYSGLTASEIARRRGLAEIADLIDGFGAAMAEKEKLSKAAKRASGSSRSPFRL